MAGFAARVAAILLAGLLVVAALTGRLDRWSDAAVPPLSSGAARASLQRVQIRAAAAYAVARALGGAIAVASSTTAQGGIGVAGVSVDVGRVLEPASQLVDVFSDVMMVSLVSTTAQIILIDILDAYALPRLLPLGLAVLMIAIAVRSPPGGAWRRLALLLVFAALAARFALPLAVAGTAGLSDRFLRPHEQAAEQSVQGARGSLPDTASSALQPGDLVGRVDAAVQGVLTWMTVFILETIAMPVGLAVLAMMIGRAVMVRALTARLWWRPDAPVSVRHAP